MLRTNWIVEIDLTKLFEAAIVIDHALIVALRETVTTANALIIVSFTDRRAASDDEGLDFVRSVWLGLHSIIVILDIFTFCRRHSHSDA